MSGVPSEAEFDAMPRVVYGMVMPTSRGMRRQDELLARRAAVASQALAAAIQQYLERKGSQ